MIFLSIFLCKKLKMFRDFPKLKNLMKKEFKFKQIHNPARDRIDIQSADPFN